MILEAIYNGVFYLSETFVPRACLKTPNYCFFLPKKGCLLCLKGLKYRQNFAVFFLIFTLLG